MLHSYIDDALMEEDKPFFLYSPTTPTFHFVPMRPLPSMKQNLKMRNGSPNLVMDGTTCGKTRSSEGLGYRSSGSSYREFTISITVVMPGFQTGVNHNPTLLGSPT